MHGRTNRLALLTDSHIQRMNADKDVGSGDATLQLWQRPHSAGSTLINQLLEPRTTVTFDEVPSGKAAIKSKVAATSPCI
jgi:hypothetical protein